MTLNFLATLLGSVLAATLAGWLALRTDLENRLFLCLLVMLACHAGLTLLTRPRQGCGQIFFSQFLALTGVGLRYVAQALGAPRGGMAAFSLVGAMLGLWAAEPWSRGCWKSLLVLGPLAQAWLFGLAWLDPAAMGLGPLPILAVSAYGAVMACSTRFSYWTMVGTENGPD